MMKSPLELITQDGTVREDKRRLRRREIMRKVAYTQKMGPDSVWTAKAKVVEYFPSNRGRRHVVRLKVRKGGIAIAGPGGIASAGEGGTAVVGPGGSAYTEKDGTAIVGPGGKLYHQEVVKARSGDSQPRYKLVALGPIVYYPNNKHQ